MQLEKRKAARPAICLLQSLLIRSGSVRQGVFQVLDPETCALHGPGRSIVGQRLGRLEALGWGHPVDRAIMLGGATSCSNHPTFQQPETAHFSAFYPGMLQICISRPSSSLARQIPPPAICGPPSARRALKHPVWGVPREACPFERSATGGVRRCHASPGFHRMKKSYAFQDLRCATILSEPWNARP
jgi:hypothetical protein